MTIISKAYYGKDRYFIFRKSGEEIEFFIKRCMIKSKRSISPTEANDIVKKLL